MKTEVVMSASPRGDNYRTVRTPIGVITLYRFSGPDCPAGRPWHVITCGRFFDSPESARDWIATWDFSEPTEAEMLEATRQSDADQRQYMLGVEYACGIRD